MSGGTRSDKIKNKYYVGKNLGEGREDMREIIDRDSLRTVQSQR